MMLAKGIVLLSALVGCASESPDCDTVVYCDSSNGAEPKAVKLKQTYPGGVKAVLTLSCTGTGSARACVDRDVPDGFFGAVVAEDDGEPMCEILYSLFGTAKNLISTCKGRRGKIKQKLRITGTL